MQILLGDIRYALRVLTRTPTATAVALVTLTLAIGVSAAIFTILDVTLIRPLPFPSASRLVQLARGYPDGSYHSSISMAKLAFWIEHARSFEAIGGYEDLGSGFNLTDGRQPAERVAGTRVTASFFDVLGVAPAVGRVFRAEDAAAGRQVAVISYGLWERRFGADRAVVGRRIALNDEPYEVVGVMPRGFALPGPAEIWTPLVVTASVDARHGYLGAIARLRDGESVRSAAAHMQLLRTRYAALNPQDLNEGETFRVIRLQESLYGETRTALLLFGAVVALVLVIACANLANLQLARALARSGEVAVRLALGASSTRILRQLLTEAIVLAVIGGAAGLLLAQWLLPIIVQFAPAELQGTRDLAIDLRVVLFTMLLSLVAGLSFGLVPARQTARTALVDTLRAGRNIPAAGTHARLWLVGAEVALAVVVLVGAALLARTFLMLTSRDPGFAADQVLTMKLNLLESRYGDAVRFGQFASSVLEEARATPGVEAAALATSLPLETATYMPFVMAGRAQAADAAAGRLRYVGVTPDFFAALRVPLVRGRSFTVHDDAEAPLVAVINETAARRFWPNRDAIGEQIVIGRPNNPEVADTRLRQVVGIVGDVREQGMEVEPPPMVYVPIAQVPEPLLRLFVRFIPVALVVRSRDENPGGLTASVQHAVTQVDPRVPITHVVTLRQIVDQSLGTQWFNALLICGMAVLALTLCAAGIYGVLAFLVHQRSREIGIRMALGASRRTVLALVLRQGLTPAISGAVAGLAAAAMFSRTIQGLLHGVAPADPASFAAAALFVIVAAGAAAYVPARRALRIEPTATLKELA